MIKQSRKYAYGLSAHSDGIISASADYIDISSQVNSSGDAITVYAKSGPRLNERTTQIDLDAKESIILHATSAEDSTGITSTIFSEGSSAASFVNLNSKTTKLVATGSNTFGIATYASEISTAPVVNVNSSQIEIGATGKKAATGVYAGSNSVVNIGNKDADLIKISATSENKDQSNAENYAFGIWVENNVVAKTDPSDKENPETLSTIAGEVNVTGKNVLITAEGDNDVRGVFVASNLLSPKKRATLNIVADNIRIEATNTGKTQKSEGISAMSTGAVNLEGNTFIKADYAILARGDASVQINKDGKHSTQLEGNIVFDYDGPSSGTAINANVDVTLSGTDSYWKGNTMIHWNGLPNSNAKDSDTADLLKVTDMKLTVQNGAEWVPTAIESSDAEAENGQAALALNSLTLDKGVVKVDSKVNVNVEKMAGTGTVKLATDLTAEEGAQAGTFTVGSAAEDSALTVKLTNADMTKDLTSDDVTADQAKKLIGNVAAADAEKTLVVDEGMYNAGFDVTEEGSTISHGPNSVMQSTLELAAAAPLALNRILINDVHKRMGDIRSMKETSGAWVRYDGGKLSAESGLDNDFHTIQVGVDTVPAADAPRFGLAFSYTMSDADYSRGKADMDAYSLAAYGLWMGDAGQFVDVVARLGTAKTDMTIDGNKKGSMDNIVTALSGEFGWRFDFAKNFYVEPQVELAYTHVDADSLSLSDGSTYRFDDADSLMGRAGFALGLQCPENGNTAYLRVSAVHEFLGDAAVTGGNGAVYEIDGKDTWVEYGLGANFHLTDSTYVWADLERTSGGLLDEDYRATIGVRHAF